MLTPDLEAQIRQHAKTKPREEVCGLVILTSDALSTVPCVNVSPRPEKSFLINPSAIAPYMSNSTLKAYYHSHHDTGEKPSEADIAVSENAKLPMIVYSLPNDAFFEYTPQGKQVPLFDRRFEFGVFDCFTFFRDYYHQKLGIEVRPFEATVLMLKQGIDDYHSQMISRGFKPVVSPKEHDVVCMSVGTEKGRCNHLAVYSSANEIAHQLLHRVSEAVFYGGYWKNATLGFYRHISQP